MSEITTCTCTYHQILQENRAKTLLHMPSELYTTVIKFISNVIAVTALSIFMYITTYTCTFIYTYLPKMTNDFHNLFPR